jgi:hypothetical protein
MNGGKETVTKNGIDLKRISSPPIKRGFKTKPVVFVQQIFSFAHPFRE